MDRQTELRWLRRATAVPHNDWLIENFKLTMAVFQGNACICLAAL